MGYRNIFKILRNKFTGKNPLGRPRCRCEDNTTIYLKTYVNMWNWIDSAQDSNHWKALLSGTFQFHKPWG